MRIVTNLTDLRNAVLVASVKHGLTAHSKGMCRCGQAWSEHHMEQVIDNTIISNTCEMDEIL